VCGTAQSKFDRLRMSMRSTCIQRCVQAWAGSLDGAPFPFPDLLPRENVLSASPTRL
jgi:hypothetical protein